MTQYIEIPKKDRTMRIIFIMAVMGVLTPLFHTLRSVNGVSVSDNSFAAGYVIQIIGLTMIIAMMESNVKLDDEYTEKHEVRNQKDNKVKL